MNTSTPQPSIKGRGRFTPPPDPPEIEAARQELRLIREQIDKLHAREHELLQQLSTPRQ